jgi:hypothetical protein
MAPMMEVIEPNTEPRTLVREEIIPLNRPVPVVVALSTKVWSGVTIFVRADLMAALSEVSRVLVAAQLLARNVQNRAI